MDKYFVSKPELQESAVNLNSEAEAMMHMLNNKALERGVNLSTHIWIFDIRLAYPFYQSPDSSRV